MNLLRGIVFQITDYTLYNIIIAGNYGRYTPKSEEFIIYTSLNANAFHSFI